MQRYGHDLIQVLSDTAHMDEVAGILEPNKPALAARMPDELFQHLGQSGQSYVPPSRSAICGQPVAEPRTCRMVFNPANCLIISTSWKKRQQGVVIDE